jgi:hypothetical protein
LILDAGARRSIIVGGMAFLISGLIFLLPREEWSNEEKLLEQIQSEVQSYLDATRDHGGQ